MHFWFHLRYVDAFVYFLNLFQWWWSALWFFGSQVHNLRWKRPGRRSGYPAARVLNQGKSHTLKPSVPAAEQKLPSTDINHSVKRGTGRHILKRETEWEMSVCVCESGRREEDCHCSLLTWPNKQPFPPQARGPGYIRLLQKRSREKKDEEKHRNKKRWIKSVKIMSGIKKREKQMN